jgi:retron-type reverse transcriptase
MKVLPPLFERVISVENQYRASLAAARGRRFREPAADFHFHREAQVHRLRQELLTRSYRHGPYRQFTVFEPKERQVAAAAFRDRVVHHALHDVIEPVIDRTFIFDSYACRKGKGTHKALDRAQHFLRANRFYLHGDIRRYFASIDPQVLLEIIERRVQDEGVLWLIRDIVRSSPAPVGLPIGNLTSQFFANLYLNELDWFVKRRLGVRYYLRYMDDFLLFAQSREALAAWKEDIAAFLREKLRLSLHDGKTRLAPVREGVSFLGFRLFRSHRRLRTDNVSRFRRRLRLMRADRKAGILRPAAVRLSIECWVSHSSYAQTKALRRRLFNPPAPAPIPIVAGGI